jgi:hypothetical protein
MQPHVKARLTSVDKLWRVMRKGLLLMVIALLAAGCAAAGNTGSSSTTPTAGTQTANSSTSPGPTADQCAGTGYAHVVGCHLQVASTLNQAINQACSNYLAPQCASTIGRYQTELLAAAHDLSSVAVPTSLAQANSSLLGAISTDLSASRQALEAINARDLSGFLGAISMHIRAGSLLTQAGSQALSAIGG